MSKAGCEDARMGTPQFYFGRREEKPKIIPKSLLKHFNISCSKCGALNVQARLERGEDSDNVKVYLWCPACNVGEELPVR